MKGVIKEGRAVTLNGDTGAPYGQWLAGPTQDDTHMIVHITYASGHTDACLVERSSVSPLVRLVAEE